MKNSFLLLIGIILAFFVLNVAFVSGVGCPQGIGTPCGDNCCQGNDVCLPNAPADWGEGPMHGTCCKPPMTIPCGNICCRTGDVCDSESESRCRSPNQTYCPHICVEKSSNHACNGPAGYTTLSDDPSNCGSCGNTCPSNQGCVNGRCSSPSSFCPQGQVVCIPGSSSEVTNPELACGGKSNTGGCYCANTCAKTASECDGCFTNARCLPIGTRLNGEFCSLEKRMQSQINEDQDCQNNFECISNVCSGKCISLTLIQKIINWFKQLFGLG